MPAEPAYFRTDDERLRAHDRHRHWVPVLVVGFLLLLTYLWTDLMASHPLPGIDALMRHPLLGEGFSSQGHLHSNAWIHFGRSAIGSDAERKILLLLSVASFLLFYYLPLGLKKQPVVILTILGLGWVFGSRALACFLGWQFLTFLTFHAPEPRRLRSIAVIVLMGVCAAVGFSPEGLEASVMLLVGAAVAAAAIFLLYALVYRPLLGTRARSYLQGGVANSSLLFVVGGLAWNGFVGGNAFPRPLGFLLFFWQWERMVMYWLDFKDGLVPHDLPVFEYLATFLSPGFLSNTGWLGRIPKGYAYLTNSFLARDKNRIVLSGVWLLALSASLFYLRGVILAALRMGVEALGLPVWTSYTELVAVLHSGVAPPVASVWVVLVYAFLNFYMLWAGVAHLKVGLWRIVGYDIEPYFQKPFASTNLIEWWKRYSFYYREFLMQAFYLPVFLRCFKKRHVLRMFTATMAAAGLGNLVFHVMDGTLEVGSTPSVWAAQFRTIPYYLLVGGGVGLTQIWIHWRGRNRRRAWTWGWRIALDVLAVIGTVGFFVLVRPFHHVPLKTSLSDAFEIVLAALGAGSWR